MDAGYKRHAASSDELPFMLQKGPLLTLENGLFVYNGAGLNISTGNSFILNVRGESSLSTKILLPDGVYLFDLDNNPVHTELTDLTIHGGKGLVRYKSKNRAVGGLHLFDRLRVSRYTQCAISNNSIDMPYMRVRNSVFYGDISKPTIGVAISGLSAGGDISNCLFSDNQYGIKLAVGDNGTERNGPATPFNIVGNDFYRTGNRYTTDSGGNNVPAESYDVWLEPGATSNNAGRGIVFSSNKFGQERLRSPDSHILVADSLTNAGDNLNGDRLHSNEVSSGFLSGVTFTDNNVNSSNAGYIAPFIKTNTPNIGNIKINDLYDNDMPLYIIEFNSLITQTQVGNLSRTNVFNASQCMALQEGGRPQRLSNLNDIFKVVDPLYFYTGHPQNMDYVRTGTQMQNFVWDFSSPTYGIVVQGATKEAVPNSYGGISEASEITMADATGRLVLTQSGLLPSRNYWIDFELKMPDTQGVEFVEFSILSANGSIVYFRRNILLDTARRWQRVVFPFTPSESGNHIIRVLGKGYTTTTNKFIVGNMNIYQNSEPLNTGHNGGLRMSWDLQHEVKGGIHTWYDSSGNLRAKTSAPTSATDGVIISANPVIS